ncbi:LysR family transcriptional regulator [Sediminibacillus massiliensis]|uniref:LysR family transcriptional regulator n=1 Tax=Sediminibacillus massiliensis TaxID=1926277 RepID=UPI0015C2C2A2|nr:LysR family transcriptional regulator [Sediminibacillus massiliensis]
MKKDDYELLVGLKRAGTIRGAAQQLLISQPAISQRLKQIEDQWGEDIFIRSHKTLTITPAGEEIIHLAERVVEAEKKVREKISSLSDEIKGTLSLGVSSVIAQYLLPEVLERFVAAYPHVKIELQTGLSNVFRHSWDDFHLCLVREDKPKGPGYCQELFSDNLYLVEKRDRKQNGNIKPFIQFQSDPTFHTMVDSWLHQQPDITFSKSLKVDQIQTCKQFVCSGIGTAVLPEIAIHDLDSKEYHFIPLQVDGKSLTRQTWVCASEAAMRLPQVKAFLRLLDDMR